MHVALMLVLLLSGSSTQKFIYDTQNDRMGKLDLITMCIRWFPRTSWSTDTCLPDGTGYSDGEYLPNDDYVEIEEEDLGDFLREDYPNEELIDEMEEWRDEQIERGIDTYDKDRNPQGPEVVESYPYP